MKQLTLIKIISLVVYLILTFGVIGPFLLSAKSTTAVVIGIVVCIIPLFVALAIYNRTTKK